jgi:capsular polysaccharide biosynthesis protein
MYDDRWNPNPTVTGSRRKGVVLTESPGDEFSRPLRELIQPIRRWFWVVALTVVICMGAAIGFSLMQTPVYQASIKILVGQEGKMFVDPSQAAYLQDLTPTLSEAIATRPVMEPVVQELDLQKPPEALMNATKVQPIADSQFIDVTYQDTDPDTARTVVNAIGDEFQKQISGQSPEKVVSISVWERAVESSQISPSPKSDGIIGAIIGTILGVGLAFLLDFRDRSWRSPEEAEQVSGVPTIGAIPGFKALGGGKKR